MSIALKFGSYGTNTPSINENPFDILGTQHTVNDSNKLLNIKGCGHAIYVKPRCRRGDVE
jgi:hypothetical protein